MDITTRASLIAGYHHTTTCVHFPSHIRQPHSNTTLLFLYLFFSCCSRIAVVWLPLHFVPLSRSSPGLSFMLLAWSVTEIIRYSYYFFNLLGVNIGILTWLRYTLFIILYPLGVSGEMWCYYDSLSALKTSKIMTLEMPNPFNFTFSPYVVTIMILLGYIPGFPPLYFHMFALRKKVLGGGDKKKTA